jgi:ubiquinone/menaquinone biosynthesis C-methylase UbiE
MNGGAWERSVDGTGSDFDGQSADFDARVGIGEERAAQVARCTVEMMGLARGETIIDIGAGTGEIGRHSCKDGIRAVAIDQSESMLRRWPTTEGPCLRVVADANEGWPVADRSVRGVFCSRAVHLLDREHVATEVHRVMISGGCLIIGRVVRDSLGYRELMREKMRSLVAETGATMTDGRKRTERLVAKIIDFSGEPMGDVVAAEWSRSGCVADVIDGWRGKSKLGGVTMDAKSRDRVLDQVESWAVERFGDLTVESESKESYVLAGVRLAN